ncbi:hypothetical protein NWF32_22115 [Pseudomonas qingdaonensis]|nr:hypothetical protein [Pseudomonas qingdaonensis]
MFGGKWREQVNAQARELQELKQQNLVLQQENQQLTDLLAQTQGEQAELNAYSRYQCDLHSKMGMFDESMKQTRDGVVSQAETLRGEVDHLKANSGVFSETSELLSSFSTSLTHMAGQGVSSVERDPPAGAGQRNQQHRGLDQGHFRPDQPAGTQRRHRGGAGR